VSSWLPLQYILTLFDMCLQKPSTHPSQSLMQAKSPTSLEKSNISGIDAKDVSSHSQSSSPNMEFTPLSDKPATPCVEASRRSSLAELCSTLDFNDEATILESEGDMDHTVKTQPPTTPTAELMSSSFLSQRSRQSRPGAGVAPYSTPLQMNKPPSPSFVTQVSPLYRASSIPPRARSLSPHVTRARSPGTHPRATTPPSDRHLAPKSPVANGVCTCMLSFLCLPVI
jgi:hypothetical protein